MCVCACVFIYLFMYYKCMYIAVRACIHVCVLACVRYHEHHTPSMCEECVRSLFICVCVCTCFGVPPRPKASARRRPSSNAPRERGSGAGGWSQPVPRRKEPREVIRCPGAVIGRGAACHADVTRLLVADWPWRRVCLAHVLAAALPGSASDGFCHKDLTDLPSADIHTYMPTRPRLADVAAQWRLTAFVLGSYLPKLHQGSKKETRCIPGE